MQAIYDWIKNLVYFYIFITAVLYLLPQKSYQKYVKFFSGLLLVILVFSPILSFVQDGESLYQKIEQAEFFQKMDNLKLDTAYLKDSGQQMYRKEYEKSIGMDIEQMAKRQELVAKEVSVRLTEDCRVERIEIEAELSGNKEAYPQKALFSQGKEYPAIYELRKELKDFYQIEEEQIEITVEGGNT